MCTYVIDRLIDMQPSRGIKRKRWRQREKKRKRNVHCIDVQGNKFFGRNERLTGQ